MNDLRKRMLLLTEDFGDDTPAGRFIMTAEKWLTTSVDKHGVHTPSMDELGNDRVAMEPLQYPENRRKAALFVINHLCKLADVLKITLVAIGVPSSAEWLYDAFLPEHGALYRYPK